MNPPTTANTPKAKTDRHVHEADVVRVLTFACVIAVHTFSHTSATTNSFSNGLEVLLHFTREAFFCLTAFVLMHQYGRGKYDLARFWSRRLLLVGVPYAVWTLLYTGWPHRHERWHTWTSVLGNNLLFGSAAYHLYFLLVSLQVYLLFPLLSRLVRVTAGHHRALIAASAALQIALLGWLAYGPAWTGWAAHLANHQDSLFWNYQFWIIAGAVGAWHLPELRSWTEEHYRAISQAVCVSAVIALAWYVIAVERGSAPAIAAAVLQPVMVLWSAAAILGLFALGTVWQRQQHPGRLQRVLDTGSDRSFGIFLIHPMILGWILNADGHWLGHHIINPFFSVLCYVLVVVFSIAATEVMRRSPLSLILTGRHQLGHSWRQGLAGRLKQDNRRETPETERSANATHDSSPTWTRDQTPA